MISRIVLLVVYMNDFILIRSDIEVFNEMNYFKQCFLTKDMESQGNFLELMLVYQNSELHIAFFLEKVHIGSIARD